MSTEEDKAMVRRVYEEFNKRNLDVYYELHAADYVFHQPDGQELGLEAFKQSAATLLSAAPDYHQTIEDFIAEGDKVVVRFTATATHSSEFMGIAATGKQVTITGILIRRIAGGKVVEEWAERDMLGLMQQLGAIPAPGQG